MIEPFINPLILRDSMQYYEQVVRYLHLFHKRGEIKIDPLYEINDWRGVVETKIDLASIMNAPIEFNDSFKEMTTSLNKSLSELEEVSRISIIVKELSRRSKLLIENLDDIKIETFR